MATLQKRQERMKKLADIKKKLKLGKSSMDDIPLALLAKAKKFQQENCKKKHIKAQQKEKAERKQLLNQKLLGKRPKPGRPPKKKLFDTNQPVQKQKRGPGRPRKYPILPSPEAPRTPKLNTSSTTGSTKSPEKKTDLNRETVNNKKKVQDTSSKKVRDTSLKKAQDTSHKNVGNTSSKEKRVTSPGRKRSSSLVSKADIQKNKESCSSSFKTHRKRTLSETSTPEQKQKTEKSPTSVRKKKRSGNDNEKKDCDNLDKNIFDLMSESKTVSRDEEEAEIDNVSLNETNSETRKAISEHQNSSEIYKNESKGSKHVNEIQTEKIEDISQKSDLNKIEHLVSIEMSDIPTENNTPEVANNVISKESASEIEPELSTDNEDKKSDSSSPKKNSESSSASSKMEGELSSSHKAHQSPRSASPKPTPVRNFVPQFQQEFMQFLKVTHVSKPHITENAMSQQKLKDEILKQDKLCLDTNELQMRLKDSKVIVEKLQNTNQDIKDQNGNVGKESKHNFHIEEDKKQTKAKLSNGRLVLQNPVVVLENMKDNKEINQPTKKLSLSKSEKLERKRHREAEVECATDPMQRCSDSEPLPVKYRKKQSQEEGDDGDKRYRESHIFPLCTMGIFSHYKLV